MTKSVPLIGSIVSLLFAIMAFSWLSPVPGYAADDSLCARVKIEIRQEITLERKAFDAHMRINNGLSGIPLENVSVDVIFSDADGNSVLASSDPDNTDAVFFIRLDSMDNIDDVSGSGSVAPSTSADIHWLIIPSPGASDGIEQGKLYYVGATLSYTVGGEENTTEVTPDYIYVKPMPELVLDYFLPSEVYGDDAFTQEIEPPVPFSLGIRVRNNGSGIARNLKIDSAQPKIVDNEQGLLIDFVIDSCEVNGESAQKSLLADFGDIEPNSSGVARWVMTCTLSGRFVDFSAEFSHSDELGGELTSLIDSANTHFLVRDVLVDLPGRDSISDFLAKDGDVFRVYESDSIDTEVVDQSSSSTLTPGESNGAETEYTLNVPVTAGFLYVRLSDPFNGQKIISGAVRSDGKTIKPQNVWLSKTRNPDHSWNYYVNLFDANTTDEYTITFADESSTNHPPVLQFIPNHVTVENQQVSFIVQATDPDGTIPTLSASPLPAGATFTDNGDGTATFDWTPSIGQAGTYQVTFKASDGVQETSQPSTITVNSVDDTDGDGMPDAWEMDHFGTLERDGTGDFDGDGISDLEEYLHGSDPAVRNHAPGIPVIESPANGVETDTVSPELVIENSTDEDGETLTYEFEVYADPGFETMVSSSSNVQEGQGSTSWTIPEALNDNSWYYWRVRATDGYSYSLWAYGSFFVNTENDPPGHFHAIYPPDGSEVFSLNPVLEVSNSVDVDGDTVNYTFQVYSDEDLTSLVASSGSILSTRRGTTSWVVNTPLDDNTTYYWTVIATDEDGAQTATEVASFHINSQAQPLEVPVTSAPVVGSEVSSLEVDLVANNIASPVTPVYYFELDTMSTFDSPAKQSSGAITQGNDTTAWHVDGLEDNTRYFWRVKAGSGSSESPWRVGEFFVNTVNDPPPAPRPKNPGMDAWVDTTLPILSVAPVADPDGDTVSYDFEIYSDDSLTNLVAQGESSTPEWIVSAELQNGKRYYWRTRAKDEHGLAGPWMSQASFLVSIPDGNASPAMTILEPAFSFHTNDNAITIRWNDSDPDSNALISLFYDTESSGENGTLIASDIEEDPDGSGDSYTWDTSSLEGSYSVYATISDSGHTSTVQGPGRLVFDRTPPAIEAQPAGDNYVSPIYVALSANESANIYYTLNGDDPTDDSSLYTAPILVSGNVTLKFMAVDPAGNESITQVENYAIGPHDLTCKVQTDSGDSLRDLRVYVFTEGGSYTGKYSTTDEDGKAVFDPEDLSDGSYKFRVDYLGQHFWSEAFSLPGTCSVDVTIEQSPTEVSVQTASGPAEGVKVYLFSEAGSYLGRYLVTDNTGTVSFDLPVGCSFKFRADMLGNQYFSDAYTVSGTEENRVEVDAGGGHLQVTVQEDAGHPMEGIKVYLFSSSGSYLGKYALSDSGGTLAFDVSSGTYKLRADYLGYHFWSDDVEVTTDTSLDLNIAHQDVNLTVYGKYEDTLQPLEAIKVYLFSPSGTYLGTYRFTDENGQAVFHVPQKAYKVRADYLGGHFWSEEFTWQDKAVNIPLADADVTVTGAGLPKEGVQVYLFTSSGSYLGRNGTTDSEGKVRFRIPEGTYKFRADYQGGQFWSEEVMLAASQVNPVNISTGGGTFTVTVDNADGAPFTGVKCYVFNDSGNYIGLCGSTDSDGRVSFDLSDGNYRFRVDYLGNQFWSDSVTVPESPSLEMTIDENQVNVSVNKASGACEGVKVYLFSENDSYLGKYQVTDPSGQVSFNLPVGRTFKFRADMLGNQYFSDPLTVSETDPDSLVIDAGGGILDVVLKQADSVPMEGVKAYLFSQSGSYLGLNDVSDSAGHVTFDLSQGMYRVRADYLGYQFWSDEIDVNQDTNYVLLIPHQVVNINVRTVFQGTEDAVEGVKVYLFNPTGSYLGRYETTDSSGSATFNLPQKEYKVRADYLGSQFWSGVFNWENPVVSIPMGEAEVTVTGAGLPQEGVKVYAFSENGSYLGMNASTDTDGKVRFRLPAGTYKFRADYLGNRYWSGVEVLNADQVTSVIVSTGGGTFAFRVSKQGADPISGVKCYVFDENGSYVGLSGSTNEEGQVFYDLSDGAYKIRADYLGYQFWSDLYNIPSTLSGEIVLPHQDVTVTVLGFYQETSPLAGLSTYLFTPSGSYLGQHGVTDADGQVFFNLPDREYKVRVDYLGNQYWSETFRSEDTSVIINQGVAIVHIYRANGDVTDARVYLFGDGGTYLGQYENTDASGTASFTIPEGSYKFRVDENGSQHWTQVVSVQAGEETRVDVDLDQ